MPIEAQTVEYSYVGDGVTTVFPFPSRFLDASDILVGLNYTLQGSGYTVTGAGDTSGGAVTFSVAPASGVAVSLIRRPPISQLLDFINGQTVLEGTLDNGFDKLTMISQYIYRMMQKSVRLSEFDPSTLDPLPAVPTRRLKVLAFDQYGSPVPADLSVAVIPQGVLYDSLIIATNSPILAPVVAFNTRGYALAGDGGAALYRNISTPSPQRPWHYQSTDGRWWELAEKVIRPAHLGGSVADATAAAYAFDAVLVLGLGDAATLVCNPTTGDNIQAMANWISGKVIQPEGAAPARLALADGMHSVSTYIDITRGRRLEIDAVSGLAETLQITAAAFTPVSGNIYEATITVATALPARVVAGFPIGCQNCKGAGGAHALNGGHIVTSVDPGGLSFKFQFKTFGEVPVDTIVFDNATTLGLLANQVVVPRAALRVNSAGWDGAAREGFFNATGGSAVIRLRNIGVSYDGAQDEHDIAFASGAGSFLDIANCVIAGAGDKLVRTGAGGFAFVFATCLGGGVTGRDGVISQLASSAVVQRCSLGSCSSVAVGALDGSTVSVDQSAIASSAVGVRPTYSNASISFANGRIANCNIACTLTLGLVAFGTAVTILNCNFPFSIANVGAIKGNPTLTNNGVGAVVANRWVNGGHWHRDSIEPGLVGPNQAETVTYGSIPAGGHEDSAAIPFVGAAMGDEVIVTLSVALPATELNFLGFVSSAGNVKVRKQNLGTGTIAGASHIFTIKVRAR